MGRIAISLTVAALAGAGVAQPAMAQKTSAYPPVYVMGESDDPELLDCSTSYASVLGAAIAELRNNGVPIGTEDMALNHQALIFYVNLNVGAVVFDDGEDTGSCTGSVNVTLSTYDWVLDPVTSTNRFATLAYCRDGFQFTLTRETLEGEVNARIREKVTYCLGEWNNAAE